MKHINQTIAIQQLKLLSYKTSSYDTILEVIEKPTHTKTQVSGRMVDNIFMHLSIFKCVLQAVNVSSDVARNSNDNLSDINGQR